MTTAHRPTWKAAVARTENSAGPYSAESVLDIASHTKLKNRAIRSDIAVPESKVDVIRASLQKLKEAEKKLHSHKIQRREILPEVEEEGRKKLLRQTADVDEKRLGQKYDDGDEGDGGNDDKGRSDVESNGSSVGSDLDEEDDSSSDDEDEEALLQAELAKIRAEREEAKEKEKRKEEEEQQSKMEEAALVGNPLLNGNDNLFKASGKMKRKWNEDVVFRNQSKGESSVTVKRFINDTVRNDFHKRFLNKFIQ